MSAPYSVLFGDARPDGVDRTPEPPYFKDLHLDQLVELLTHDSTRREPDEHRLTPLLHALVDDPAVIALRQEVFDDIAKEPVRAAMDAFSARMSDVRLRLRAGQGKYVAAQQSHRWHLNAAETYVGAVRAATAMLTSEPVAATALRALGQRLEDLLDTEWFGRFDTETIALQERLRAIRYAVFLNGDRVTVGPYDHEPDYGEQVVGLFARFRQDLAVGDKEAEADARSRRTLAAGGDSVRERIVDLVAELHPEPFAELARYHRTYADFIDPTVALFHRELQLYLRYDRLVATLAAEGMPTARAELRDVPGLVARDTYDLVLAATRTAGSRHVVGNDLDLTPDERRVVVTGPNQGGKTTLSRTLGQLHHLAGIGCPVPGTRVALKPADRIFTHFEREELGHRTGKLEDDLLRIRAIMQHATPDSVVILNEIFASTTTADAVDLAQGVLARLSESRALVVCVTFLDEIAQLPDTVALVAQVDPADPVRRTFRVIRAQPDGRAYATALAAKHGLAYGDIRKRVR